LRVLIVCFSYTPENSPRALRWGALAKDWVGRGYDVHVVTSRVGSLPTEEVDNGVQVHRVGGTLTDKVHGWLETNLSGREVKREPLPSLKQKHINTFVVRNGVFKLLRTIRNAWRRLYWPDASCLSIPSFFIRTCYLMKKERFDILISVSHPFSGHIVGLLVRRFVSNFYWLADSGDPFSLSTESPANNFRIWNRLNRWAETRILESCDCFSVTTPETADLYRESFPQNAHRLTVVPPLLQPSFYESIKKNFGRLRDDNMIVLLFVGVFYERLRSPTPLLDLLEQVLGSSSELKERLQLHIVGPEAVIYEALQLRPHLTDNVSLFGRLPHHRAVELMFSADCLVNVGNTSFYQLPSKAIEYMATGKPILNLVSTERDSTSKMLSHYPCRFNWNVNEKNDLSALRQFIENSSGHSMHPSDVSKMIAPFLLGPISDQYLACISNSRLSN
jgi:glycosyltransferase involved in cell wall biosynthesis